MGQVFTDITLKNAGDVMLSEHGYKQEQEIRQTTVNMKIDERINNIKESVLKFVPAKYIYLFGSYAYGNPTEKSDIDVYIVTPDNMNNFSELYTKIIGDLSDKKIFFIDLSLNVESDFNIRKTRNRFEKTIFQKGKIIYEH
jgi:predicted nucleotidyltransferase